MVHASRPALLAHAASGPGRGGDARPPASAARGPGATAFGGQLFVPAAGLAGAAQDPADRARRDGRGGRPGDPHAGAPPGGALGLLWPAPHLRAAPHHRQGPARARVRPCANTRGSRRRPVPAAGAELPGPAGAPLPDADEVPRRAAPARRPDPAAGVLHERPLFVRCGLGWAGPHVPDDVPCIRERLPSLWRAGDRGARGLRAYRREGQPGIHLPHRRGRRPRALVRALRLRGERGEGEPPEADAPAGSPAADCGGGHAGREDDRGCGRVPQHRPRADAQGGLLYGDAARRGRRAHAGVRGDPGRYGSERNEVA